MNVSASVQAQQLMQMASAQAKPAVQSAQQVPPTANATGEETSESPAVQMAEGEIGGRINTYA
ncbi:hypothetical protein ACFQGA_13340 [Marinobacter koreensis]|uniref:Uncharacterized protein n=1 Tax=Marinobacter koreensis TaxID=335974 RepID=A0ABW0RIT9_9GAMM|nr:hypothetical protein [Marinobacter koreensis]MCK7548139.1 hypothetical protein [Marinobacter koreensis]MDX1816892.1 hypothetical protein [Marinobacter sp.]